MIGMENRSIYYPATNNNISIYNIQSLHSIRPHTISIKPKEIIFLGFSNLLVIRNTAIDYSFLAGVHYDKW